MNDSNHKTPYVSNEGKDDRSPTWYWVVELIFVASSFGFYHTIEVININKLPKQGTPTLICFNHGNGLGDPVVSCCPFSLSCCQLTSSLLLQMEIKSIIIDEDRC